MAGPPPPSPSVDAPAPQSPWLMAELRQHEEEVRGYIRHRYPDLEADDVIQESYLRLLKARTGGKIQSLRAYFFTLARHTAIGFFRRARSRPAPCHVAEIHESLLVEEAPDAAQRANANERLELLAAALETLPGRCREVMELTVVHGLTPIQIAEQMKLAESTVRVQMARGVQKCSAYLRERGEAP